MIEMIATAANEQTSAAGEISESATHISQLATENSHASEESAEGCKQLSMLANDLDGMIRQFRLHAGVLPVNHSGTQPGDSTRGVLAAQSSQALRMA
jgi:hypothetical protein